MCWLQSVFSIKIYCGMFPTSYRHKSIRVHAHARTRTYIAQLQHHRGLTIGSPKLERINLVGKWSLIGDRKHLATCYVRVCGKVKVRKWEKKTVKEHVFMCFKDGQRWMRCKLISHMLSNFLQVTPREYYALLFSVLTLYWEYFHIMLWGLSEFTLCTVKLFWFCGHFRHPHIIVFYKRYLDILYFSID